MTRALHPIRHCFCRIGRARSQGLQSLYACAIDILDERMQELWSKVSSIRPDESPIHTKRGKITGILKWFKHFSEKLGGEISFAFETIVEF